MFVLLYTVKEKDVTIGEKIIPIEIIDNLLDPGLGEATKRNKKIINRIPVKEKNKGEEATKKSLEELSLFENKLKLDNKTIENKEKLDQAKTETTSKQDTSFRKEIIGSGSKDGIINNEPEKGSLKGSGTIKVTCLKCVRPVYPPIALRRGSEGKATIKIWINKNGQVSKAKLLTKSGIESIDNSALKAAKTSTFYPLDETTIIDIEYDMKIK